jgi:predicted phage tail component-like protein
MIKTQDNFKIVYATGETFDMADNLSILVRSLNIPSPSTTVYSEKIEGRGGVVRMGRDFNSGKITAECSFVSGSTSELLSLRKTLVSVLLSKEYFYLIMDTEPTKRWKVYVSEEFSVSKMGGYGEFSLTFECDKPYAESVSSALQTKTTTTFTIVNSGDEVVNPREDSLVITYTGASINLTIRNNTTGEEWQYTGTSAAGNTIVLDGIRALKNGLSIYRNTNRKLITLAKGNNSFTLTGTSGSFSIGFDFRNKYYA